MRVQPKMIMTVPPGRGHRLCLVHHERVNTSPANRPGRRQTGRTSTNDDNTLVHDASMARFPAPVNKTNQRQGFHCDGSDLVGLLCLKPAKTGGQSKIASSMAVYNQMLASRPDLVEVLRQPFAWDATTSSHRARTRSFTCRSSSTSTARPGSSSSAGTSAMPSATSRRRS